MQPSVATVAMDFREKTLEKTGYAKSVTEKKVCPAQKRVDV